MENPIKMDDLGGFPLFFGNTHVVLVEKNQQKKHHQILRFPSHLSVGIELQHSLRSHIDIQL